MTGMTVTRSDNTPVSVDVIDDGLVLLRFSEIQLKNIYWPATISQGSVSGTITRKDELGVYVQNITGGDFNDSDSCNVTTTLGGKAFHVYENINQDNGSADSRGTEMYKFYVTVDPLVKSADFKNISEVPLNKITHAYICTPENKKFKINC